MAGQDSNPHPQMFVVQSLVPPVARLAALAPEVRRGEDIAAVHQMRVASRRLRAALALLQDHLPKKAFKDWAKLARRVTKSLGAARDADVQIAAVSAYLEHLRQRDDQAHQPGLERLRLRLTQKRRSLQKNVLATMDRLEKSDGLGAMRQALLQMRVEATLGPPAEGGAEALQRHARAEILRRLEQMLAYEPFIASPNHVQELHAMRIEAKRLRYGMETFAPLFDGKLKWQIKLIKNLQTRLGDIHDSDVWIDLLPRFLEEERRRHETFFGHRRGFRKIARGIEFFAAHCQARRSEQFDDFIAFWGKQCEAEAWSRLRTGLIDDDPPHHTQPIVAKIPRQA